VLPHAYNGHLANIQASTVLRRAFHPRVTTRSIVTRKSMLSLERSVVECGNLISDREIGHAKYACFVGQCPPRDDTIKLLSSLGVTSQFDFNGDCIFICKRLNGDSI